MRPKQHRRRVKSAVALGKQGGTKGGAARAPKLTPEQRSKIAQNAALVTCEMGKR